MCSFSKSIAAGKIKPSVMTRSPRCAILSVLVSLSFALVHVTAACFVKEPRPATKWRGGKFGSPRTSCGAGRGIRRGFGVRVVVGRGRVDGNAARALAKDPTRNSIVYSLPLLLASSLLDDSVEFWESDDGEDASATRGSTRRGRSKQQGGPDEEKSRSKRGIWIVIVDDEEPIRASVSQLLQLNYPAARITSCSNATEVLQLLSEPSLGSARDDRDTESLLAWSSSAAAVAALPDVIIADVRMPGMSGLDLVEAMRSPPPTSPLSVDSSSVVSPWAAIPVILLTAKSALQDRLDGYRVGADAYLTKPFDPDELLALVDSVVERANALAALDGGAGAASASQPLSVRDLQRELRDIKAMLLNGGGAGPGLNGFVGSTGVFLPPDERRVLELLCQGKTNPEIASEMFLSRRRVEQLLTSMYRKVSVKNRTELVRWAIATGQVQI